MILVKDYKMSFFTISGDEAYEIYSSSHLKKAGVKSASFDTIEAILKEKGVKIRPKPSDSVRFLLLRYATAPFRTSVVTCGLSLALACSGRQLPRDCVYRELGEDVLVRLFLKLQKNLLLLLYSIKLKYRGSSITTVSTSTYF